MSKPSREAYIRGRIVRYELRQAFMPEDQPLEQMVGTL